MSASGSDRTGWRPGATIEALRARAAILARIRAFFAARGVLEVETPVLAAATVTDPQLHSLETRYTGPGAGDGRRLYLQTSPEYAMKRLLAAGSGPIWQLARVFRDGEAGRLHNPEFTLLEWYRPGFDHHALMDEVEALVADILGIPAGFERVPYAELFRRSIDIDPFTADIRELQACARSHGIDAPSLDSRDAGLDLLLTHRIGPGLGVDRPVFVHDYPPSQAALARIRDGNPPVAERFELYIKGVELANGYHELGDAAEQRARFARDRERRRAAGLPDVRLDEHLLAALEHGLPECAGVALGFDRLVMLATGAQSIDEVMAFSLNRL
jgi:elongation factor P--(R)-beta-lysine ligase